MIDAVTIASVIRTIVERFHPKRIVLFGSYARGDADEESDLDLFVEMETSRRPPERAIEIASVFGLHDWPMDIFVYTPEEVKQLRGEGGTLLEEIEKEGRVLYEQS
jgi:predicted nucleotidyltransferase